MGVDHWSILSYISSSREASSTCIRMGLNERNLRRLGIAFVASVGIVLAVATGGLRIDNIPEALAFLCIGSVVAFAVEKLAAKGRSGR